MARFDPISNSLARSNRVSPTPKMKLPQENLPDELKGSLKRRLLFIFPILILTGLGVLTYKYFHREGLRKRVTQLAQIDDAAIAHRELDKFFTEYPSAIVDGALLLDDSSAPLMDQLKVLHWCLSDDYIFEMNGHRRLGLRTGNKPKVFNIHSWIASPESKEWRSRLLDLATHEDKKIRELSLELLAFIALKVPEALADSPLPPFDQESLRQLMLTLSPSTQPIQPNYNLGPLVLEAVVKEGRIQWWYDSKTEGKARLNLLLAILEQSDRSWQKEALADALIQLDSRSTLEGRLQIMNFLETLATPRALVHAIRIVSRSNEPLSIRKRSLELIGQVGTPHLGSRLGVLLEKSGEGLPQDSIQKILKRLEIRQSHLTDGFSHDTQEVESLLETLTYLRIREEGLAYDSKLGESLLKLLQLANSNIDLALSTLSTMEYCPPKSGRSLAIRALTPLLKNARFKVSKKAHQVLAKISAQPPALKNHWASKVEAWPLALTHSTEELKDENQQSPSVEEYLLQQVEQGSQREALQAAQNLAWLSRTEVLNSTWYRENRQRLIQLYKSINESERLALLELFSKQELTGTLKEQLWELLKRASFNRRPTEAWAILQTLESRIRLDIRLQGGSVKEQDQAFLWEVLRHVLNQKKGGREITMLFRFLQARHPLEDLDTTLQEVIQGTKGLGRPQLVRFFPFHPTKGKIQFLVTLLGDKAQSCRYWAHERLKFFRQVEESNFDIKTRPGSTENLKAREEWMKWADGYEQSSL